MVSDGIAITFSLILSLLMFFPGTWTIFNFFLLVPPKKQVLKLNNSLWRDQEVFGEHSSQFVHLNSHFEGCSPILLELDVFQIVCHTHFCQVSFKKLLQQGKLTFSGDSDSLPVILTK